MYTNGMVALGDDGEQITPDTPITVADSFTAEDTGSDITAGDFFMTEDGIQGGSQDTIF